MNDVASATIKNAVAGQGDALSAQPADFWALLKPRVMSLVIFTAFIGMVVAPGSIHPVLAFTSLLAIAIGAGASGALNMWWDADIDAKMKRTQSRPVPSGVIPASAALGFGLSLSVASVAMLGLFVNWLAAGLLAFTIFFYAVIYTMWLKRRTAQNIVIGGAAGALPPVVAWAAVTGTVDINALSLFLIIFMWTPPHFWALALFCETDYEAAGVPMLPNVSGTRDTRNQILIYAVLLAPIGLLPNILGFAGWFYGAVAATAGLVFVWFAFRVWHSENLRHAKRLFVYSIFYLFLLFAVLGLENLIAGGANV